MSIIPDFAAKHKYIKVLGDISVERVSKVGSMDGSNFFSVFVLLGPTGSGKSSFIEAVASNTSLGLSSDKLEGFTQSVSIYRIINAVLYDYPIYLVDVPGFADSKISAMSIVSMLKNMIQTNPILNYFRILYHTPINNPRLPGSQRQVLRTFEALTGPQSARNVTIVSTMWDIVWNENTRRRAEGNFSQLRNEIWKDYIAQGADIVKFHNTQESALTILDDTFDRTRAMVFSIHLSIYLPLQETPFASHIYNDLQARIHDLQMQQANIQSELQMATERSDENLEAILIQQLEEVQMLSTKFEEELRELGTPANRRPVMQKPVPPIDDPAPTMPGPLPTPGPTALIPESSAPTLEPVVLAPVVVPPAVSELVTSTPDNKDDLQIWIHDLQMQQASIQSKVQMAREQRDEKLRAMLIAQLEEAQVLFAKFEEELHEFGSPADPPVALEPVQPTNDPATPTPHPLPIPELTTASTPEPVASPPAAKSPKVGIFTRATNIIKGWGSKLSKQTF